MKSKITILAITLAGLSQATEVQSQQPFAAGYSPYAQVAGPSFGAGLASPPITQPMPIAESASPAAAQSGPYLIPSAPQAAADLPSVKQVAPAPGVGFNQAVPSRPAASGADSTTYHVNGGSTAGSAGSSPGAMVGSTPNLDAGYSGCDSIDGGCATGGGLGLGQGLGWGANGFGLGGGLGRSILCGQCGLPGDACECNQGGFLSRLFHHHGNGHHNGSGLFGPTPRPAVIWGGVDYLLWWNKERSVPVLATTSVAGTPYDEAGVLGQPGTSVLFGGGNYDHDPQEGIRGTMGLWLNREQTFGIYGRGFRLGTEDIGFSSSSTGNPILARPFFDEDLGQQNSLVVAYPGVSEGGINILTQNDIHGYELMLRKMLYYGYCNRLDLVGGYHTTRIDDRVHAQHVLTSVDPNGRVPVGTEINTRDWFDAESEFHGGTIGLMAQGYDGRLTWNLLTKVSFGNTNETVSIQGDSTTTIPGAGSATFNQGLLALDSNSGVYSNDEFTIVPELDLSLSYNIFNQLSVSVGYSMIYWTNAVLAGDAVDTNINPTQIDGDLIGTVAPTYSLRDRSFWAQGLTFGLQGRF